MVTDTDPTPAQGTTRPEHTGPVYPECVVRLTGTDGNAFAVMGTVRRALRRAGASQAELEEFGREAMAGDYTHLLATCAAWVVVE